MIILHQTPTFQASNEYVHAHPSKTTNPYIDLSQFKAASEQYDEYLSCPAIDDNYYDEFDYYATSARHPQHNIQSINFDSDAVPTGVDTLASACMSPHKNDFVSGTLVPYQAN